MTDTGTECLLGSMCGCASTYAGNDGERHCDFCGRLAFTDTGTERDVERVVLRICQDVCELPDRSSPDDEPDQVLVTLGELSEICRRVLTDELAALRPATDEAKPSEAERESVVQALIAEIQRQTEGDWPIDADHGKYIIDAAIDFDALAIAAMRSSDGAKGEKS